MNGSERRYGSVPKAHRKLFAGAASALGVLIFVIGLLVSFAVGAPLRWGWLIVAVGFGVGVYSIYLWIRLSD